MKKLLLLVTTCLFLSYNCAVIAQEGDIEILRQKAESGDTKAQYDLAYELYLLALENGITTEEAQSDPMLAESCQWAKKAGEEGQDAEALALYAGCLTSGFGQPEDPENGLRLYEEAADLGSIGAQLTLSEWYLEGNGLVDQNEAQGFTYALSAAKGNDKQEPNGYAQWKVGMLYLQGRGVPKDSKEAFKWVAKASENATVQAMISRAVMLATGDGITENDVEARTWYKRASESGDVKWAHGLRGLGYMIFTGEGGPEDKVTGYAYLLAARAGNDENAAILVDKFENALTREEINQSFEIAKQWTDKYFVD